MRLVLGLCCLLIISVSFMRMPISTKAAPPEYDIIIRNGRVIDGSGRAGFNADVGIKSDRIAGSRPLCAR